MAEAMFNFRLQSVVSGAGGIGKKVDGIEARIGPEAIDDGSRVLTVRDGCGNFGALRLGARGLWSPPRANHARYGGTVMTGAVTVGWAGP